MSISQSKTINTAPSGDSEFPHRYNATLANAIELKWQAKWDVDGTFITPNPGDAKFISAARRTSTRDDALYQRASGAARRGCGVLCHARISRSAHDRRPDAPEPVRSRDSQAGTDPEVRCRSR
jgi:hypothetical protein